MIEWFAVPLPGVETHGLGGRRRLRISARCHLASGESPVDGADNLPDLNLGAPEIPDRSA